MKVGETKIILVDCEEVNIDLVDKAIFTIKGADSVTKTYPGDDVSFSDGKFLINLFQEDTLKLSSGSRVYCEIEGQIVYKDRSVAKTNTELFALDRTLATELIDGNKPSATDIQHVKLEIVGDVIIAKVEGGVTPEHVKPIVEEVIEDKNLASKSDIPTKVSELENDADLVNKAYVDDGISTTKSEFSAEVDRLDERIDNAKSELESEFVGKDEVFQDVGVYEIVEASNYDIVPNMYLQSSKAFAMATNGLSYVKIPVTVGEKFKVQGQVYSAHTLYGFMDNSDALISVYPTNTSGVIPTSGGVPLTLTEEVEIPSGVAYLIVNLGNAWIISKATIWKENYVDGLKETIEIPRYSNLLNACQNALNYNFGNILYGKKLATTGTSITMGLKADTDENGVKKTYGYYTAKRNNMTFVNYGISGSTLQNISGKNPFSLPNRYQSMDADLDYLTIEFGWNDLAYGTLGTINDVTNDTFYGAWNVVLPWLIEHYPNTKIGLIVPYLPKNGADMREAVRLVAKKYGLPYMDMMGDANVPCIYGREPSFNLDSAITTIYMNRYIADGTHPNDNGYRAWATAYENFLRSM